MARNEEKKNAMLNKWLQMKSADERGVSIGGCEACLRKCLLRTVEAMICAGNARTLLPWLSPCLMLSVGDASLCERLRKKSQRSRMVSALTGRCGSVSSLPSALHKHDAQLALGKLGCET